MPTTERVVRVRAILTIAAVAGALAALVFAPAQAHAKTIRGTVVATAGVDQVRVKAGKRTVAYRLLGIAAPSEGDCFAREARRGLARVLRRGQRVRVVVGGKGQRRAAWVFAGRTLVNARLVAQGYATAADRRGLRYGARLQRAQRTARGDGRGLWGACRQGAPGDGGDEATPPADQGTPVTPPPSGGEQAIAAMTEALKGVHVFTLVATNNPGGFNSSAREDLDLCSDGRFLYRALRTSSTAGIDPIRSETVGAGTWRVINAAVDQATGVREALLEGVVDQGDGAGETVRVYLRVDGNGVSGRWNDQAAEFSRSAQCA